ncbi:MAG: hypothetical protein SFX74_11445 [Fimbriimonadaceae bacterium]|nr:hypothetical protein [Fimbriimonadaceae bacterium]
MLRIMGIQRDCIANQEFVLIQNHSSLKIALRGHCIVSQGAMDSGMFASGGHLFADDVTIPPGMYVVLRTGVGEPRWSKARDGAMIYQTYMQRAEGVWEYARGTLYILAPQHTYTERNLSSPSLGNS